MVDRLLLAIDMFRGGRKDLDDERGIGNGFLVPGTLVARHEHVGLGGDLVRTGTQLNIAARAEWHTRPSSQVCAQSRVNVLGNATVCDTRAAHQPDDSVYEFV